MLEHALAQVGQQRGVERLELVLAPHGFDPGPLSDCPVVPQPESVVFGDVLNAAVAAASGDVVLKMDDDDWYAPDFVADLLRARAYSGADLVGTADEFYYLADRDLTVQRRHPGEFYTQWVAGGTLMLDRSLLAESAGSRRWRSTSTATCSTRCSPSAPRSTAPTASATCSAATPTATPTMPTSTRSSTPRSSSPPGPASPSRPTFR